MPRLPPCQRPPVVVAFVFHGAAMPTLHHAGGQPESNHRRVLRQPRHRPFQVHRVPDHPFGRPAGRGSPLAGRHRQSGTADARFEARTAPSRPHPPVRLWIRTVLLGLCRRPCPVQHGRALCALRRNRETASPTRTPQRWGRVRHPRGGHLPRIVLPANRRQGIEPHSRRGCGLDRVHPQVEGA